MNDRSTHNVMINMSTTLHKKFISKTVLFCGNMFLDVVRRFLPSAPEKFDYFYPMYLSVWSFSIIQLYLDLVDKHEKQIQICLISYLLLADTCNSILLTTIVFNVFWYSNEICSVKVRTFYVVRLVGGFYESILFDISAKV